MTEDNRWKMKSRGPRSAANVARRMLKSGSSGLPPYTMPHKYLPLVRGVPIRDHNKPDDSASGMHPMSLPIEIQNSLAYHLEMVGLVHVKDLKAMADGDGKISVDQLPQVYLKHKKPEAGPDIQLNPGEWVHIDTPVEEDDVSDLTPSAESRKISKVNQDISEASIDELQTIENLAKAQRIKKLREKNVDAFVRKDQELESDE